MKIYVVNEVDERDEYMQSGPLCAHRVESVAQACAAKFGEDHRGEIGHYAVVLPITLDHGVVA